MQRKMAKRIKTTSSVKMSYFLHTNKYGKATTVSFVDRTVTYNNKEATKNFNERKIRPKS